MAFDLFVREALLLVLICSAVPLGCSALVGLLISLLQALTQIQEQTISYAAKFFAVCAVLWCSGGWLGPRVLRFFEEALNLLALLGRLP